MIYTFLTCFYYCWGLPTPFEGYFVLLAAILHIQSIISRTWYYIYVHIYIIWDHHLDCFDCFTNFSHCTHRINFQSFFRCPSVSCGFTSPVRAVMPLVLRQCNSASGCPELRYTGHWLSRGRGGKFLYFQATEMGHCWEKCPSWKKIWNKKNWKQNQKPKHTPPWRQIIYQFSFKMLKGKSCKGARA